MQALNNISTDYRRMDIINMVQRHYYGVLMMVKECSDTTIQGWRF